MKIDSDNILESILESLSRIDYIHSADIPNIELYMDQVTTFMDARLSSTKRYEEDKILTKTMINNYAKNNLLPPPNKKKYSREHILVLTFIYYFKNILAIKDIETLLKPLTDKYFHTDGELNLTSVYEEICSVEKAQIPALCEEMKAIFSRAENSFADVSSDVSDDERKYLQTFSLICSLGFDVYVKKQIIEKLLDELPEFHDPGSKDKK